LFLTFPPRFPPVRRTWLEDVGRIRIELEPAVMVVGA
jgi:hypothetical protein